MLPGWALALHPGGQVGGIAHGRVIHPQIVPDAPHHHRTGVEADAHLKIPARNPSLTFSLYSARAFLNGQGRMAGPLGMVLVGQGRTEQGHDPVAGELVDGPLILVDLIHQDPKAPVHDLVHFFGVELFGEGSEAGHIGKEHRDQFTLAFYEDLQVSGFYRLNVWGCRIEGGRNLFPLSLQSGAGLGRIRRRIFCLWRFLPRNQDITVLSLPRILRRTSRPPGFQTDTWGTASSASLGEEYQFKQNGLEKKFPLSSRNEYEGSRITMLGIDFYLWSK